MYHLVPVGGTVGFDDLVLQERLEKQLLEGLDSGEAIRATDKYWNNLRSRLERRANGRKSGKRR